LVVVFFGRFFDCFPVISGFSIEIHTRLHFQFSFFRVLASGPPTVASGCSSATFPNLAETSSYATGLQLNFPEWFLTRLY